MEKSDFRVEVGAKCVCVGSKLLLLNKYHSPAIFNHLASENGLVASRGSGTAKMALWIEFLKKTTKKKNSAQV